MTASPITHPSEGRKLLRLEVRNAQTPIEKKPEWIKTRAKMGPEYSALRSLVSDQQLHTVCQEAGCPNIYECWEDREATFLIGGSQCTRRCDFCQIDTGKPADYDTDEPRRVAESVVQMNLRYATVTGVARDDLPDEGAWLHAETVRMIHELNPGTGVELLACVLSLAMVVCNARLNPAGWPLAIAASALYGLLFLDSRLYGEAGLQLVFIAAAAWGWWQWLRGTDAGGGRLRVRRLAPRQRALAAAAVLAAWPLLGWLLDSATDSDVPYLDALPTVGSLLGQWLLGRKWLETWPVWLAVNLASIVLFAHKGLWLTTALYALFAAMSVWGWRAWARAATDTAPAQRADAGH